MKSSPQGISQHRSVVLKVWSSPSPTSSIGVPGNVLEMQIPGPCLNHKAKSEALGWAWDHPSGDPRYTKVGKSPPAAEGLGQGRSRAVLGTHSFLWTTPTCTRWAAPLTASGDGVGTRGFTRHLLTGHLPLLEGEAGVLAARRPRPQTRAAPRTPTHLAPALGTLRLFPAAS